MPNIHTQTVTGGVRSAPPRVLGLEHSTASTDAFGALSCAHQGAGGPCYDLSRFLRLSRLPCRAVAGRC
eukprot:9995121-Alexandrium_andersonii.AAC.1